MSRTEEAWKIAIKEKSYQALRTIDENTAPLNTPTTSFSSITQPSDTLFPLCIDHTLLKPDATPAQIDALCDEAIRFGFKSCCVNGVYVKQVAARLQSSTSIPCAVIGFPLGASTTAVKVFEAKDAISNGAREIDMVINIGLLKTGSSYSAVFEDVHAVAQACQSQGILLKVILETVFLSDLETVAGAFIAAEAGAAFVKTCTGFNGGGATKEDVDLMYRTVRYKKGDVKVKASAGIRSFEKCVEMLRAGAERIGTSSGAAIMQNANVSAASGAY
ncbi:hypothetical protein DFH05DRAFT_1496392 [Lentinula detonsa]|uniref:deoxyribose-phosphate aldolase n=1 Tax=Lentinula detonsa TaxID=2804962 RepID=A0A9W8NYS9_9AGAR|nr:hypothetical protein DFH05DRAFT_1496392 [Lentinula detonsa]KAJ3981825.1 hypothetical protein F5890DRAFT_1416943 [Lentinula detonsa]